MGYLPDPKLWELWYILYYGQCRVPRVSIVVPFWGYLIESLIYNWLNQKKGTTMETIGRVYIINRSG